MNNTHTYKTKSASNQDKATFTSSPTQPTQRREASTTEALVHGHHFQDLPIHPAEQPQTGTRSLQKKLPESGSPVIQCIFVKKEQKFIQNQSQEVYIPAKEGETGVLDTKNMKVSEREKVRSNLALFGNKYQSAIEELDREMNVISKKVDEKEIFALGKRLDKLKLEHSKSNQKLSKESEYELSEVAFRVVRALEFLGGIDEDNSDVVRFRVLLLKYLEQINKLDDKALGKAVEHGERPVDLNVTDEDIKAYRGDIAENGNWGGGAEASVIATAFNFQCRLLILDSDNNYVLVDTIGAGNLSNRSLLNVGNHYAVVNDNALPGQTFNNAHVLYNAPLDGDCLFWALHNVAADGGDTVQDVNVAPIPVALNQLNAQAFIGRAREIVSTGLTNEQIRETIIEMRVGGGNIGMGPRLARRVNLHRFKEDDIRKRFKRTGLKDSELYDKVKEKLTEQSKTIDNCKNLQELLDFYDKYRNGLMKAPKDSKDKKEENKRNQATIITEQILNAFLSVAAENAPSLNSNLVSSEGQDLEIENNLRKESAEQLRRSGIKVEPSPHNKTQLIVTIDDEQFVMDRIGQLVPRHVHRGISEFNQAELKKKNFMYPTGSSPIPKEDTFKDLRPEFSKQISKSASGISDNKLKASLEMLHVEGMKPSPFMSTTAIQGGTKNPKGETFGKSVHVIDLAYLPPSVLAATYTDRGMGYYLLSAFKGSSEDKANIIKKARGYQKKQETTTEDKKQKPSTKIFGADDAAKDDSTLSGKEWQALMDVIRTEEILISAPIPVEAIQKK